MYCTTYDVERRVKGFGQDCGLHLPGTHPGKIRIVQPHFHPVNFSGAMEK